jgi:hypothetical protein
MKLCSKSCEDGAKFRYLATELRKENCILEEIKIRGMLTTINLKYFVFTSAA